MQLRRHLSPQGCRFKQCTTPTLSARARAEITPSVHWNIHTVHGNHRACMGLRMAYHTGSAHLICSMRLNRSNSASLEARAAAAYTHAPLPVRHIYPWVATVTQGQNASIEGVA